jgi:hypothetical protein
MQKYPMVVGSNPLKIHTISLIVFFFNSLNFFSSKSTTVQQELVKQLFIITNKKSCEIHETGFNSRLFLILKDDWNYLRSFCRFVFLDTQNSTSWMCLFKIAISSYGWDGLAWDFVWEALSKITVNRSHQFQFQLIESHNNPNNNSRESRTTDFLIRVQLGGLDKVHLMHIQWFLILYKILRAYNCIFS